MRPRLRSAGTRLAAACATAACAAAAGSGCGPGEVRISLVPVALPGSCGRPADGRSLLVSALGDFPEDRRPVDLGAPVDLAGFPPATRQLAVEVLGGGGVKAAVGKTAPLELDQLADGDQVPIAMVPLDGFCPTEPMAAARDRPIVVRAGAGALILGGTGPAGPVASAEYYDPATASFAPVGVPSAFTTELGFTGAAATRMPDGRVVLSGGPSAAYATFEPATASFAPPGALLEVRAFHAAVALDDERVLIAGGCSLAAGGGCEPGTERTTTKIIDLTTGEIADGPALAGVRLGGTAQLEATGADLTGAPDVLLAGGVDAGGNPVDTIERLDPDQPTAPPVVTPGASGLVAPLAAGGVLVALAPDGAAAAGGAAVIAPGQAPHVVGATAGRAGATLTPLEDGGVIAIGGAPAGTIARYVPAHATWRTIVPGGEPPAGLAGQAAVRLDDGTVLVVGGHDGLGEPGAGAWLYRPPLDGPFASAVTATPAVDDEPPLDPLDPARVHTDTGVWQLDGAGPGVTSWALVTGPEVADGLLVTRVRPTAGGAAVLLGFTGPAGFDAVVLAPGEAARLERHAPGGVATLCTGDPIDLVDSAAVTISVERRGERITAAIDDVGVLDCALGGGARGLWGVAPVGTGALVVDTVSISR
jgi:hypothetical protein